VNFTGDISRRISFVKLYPPANYWRIMEGKNISGSRIRERRKEKGLLLVDVVAALSVDFNVRLDTSALGRIERYQRSVTDYELVALSKILDVSLSWLVGEE
jgi:transcriptional regulator with XRE-family HTH domain